MNPKLFISYSWTNQDHEEWVLELASSLRNSAVDVILDKWDLKEGNDSVAFMEKMVNDPEIKKVALVCNKIYAEKANGRQGGVGTETQIISRKVYEKADQSKFVAVVTEKDENGNAYLPTYYGSRIYIDLSESEKYSANYERLLRWIYDKPLFVKPELGQEPTFLSQEATSLGVNEKYRRAIDALQNGKQIAKGATIEYLDGVSANLERFRVEIKQDESDDNIIKSIENFLPYRNEYIRIIESIAKYQKENDYNEVLHSFLESLLKYYDKPENVYQWNEVSFDNYRFIIHEMFLYTITVFIKYNCFETSAFLLSEGYYSLKRACRRDERAMASYTDFREHMSSLEIRNKRLGLRRLSLRADMLKERNGSSGIRFYDVMQTDFICYLRNEIHKESGFIGWWPETLLYLGDFYGRFEIFAKAESVKYFDRIKTIFSIDKKEDLLPTIKDFSEGKRYTPQWEFEKINPDMLIGYEKLCTKA